MCARGPERAGLGQVALSLGTGRTCIAVGRAGRSPRTFPSHRTLLRTLVSGTSAQRPSPSPRKGVLSGKLGMFCSWDFFRGRKVQIW